jgi:hypothetical protein
MSSAILSYIRKNATSVRTTLTVEQGVTIRLAGMPVSYTVDGVGKLAGSQLSDAKGAVRTAMEDGRKVSSAFSLAPDKAEQLIRGPEAPAATGRAGKRQTNGEPVAASSNGSAS